MRDEDDFDRILRGHPPAWASGWGHDEFGAFVTLAIGEVEQRFRWIPKGTFWMGSPASDSEAWEDERPRHEVTLSEGFWLADTPCTQALWLAVMGTNPSRFTGSLELPVETVSWDDVQTFLATLTARFEGSAARLPTEAQWERACRAGSDEPRYGELDSIAWYSENSDIQTHEVGQKAANRWGLFDMLGNVWEWCADNWRDYDERALVDPTHQRRGLERVIRGGGWDSYAPNVRAAYRTRDGPGLRYGLLGFRLVLSQGGLRQEPAEQPVSE
ncbi:formylglycine-generating enzyme family protein [Nannocystaceae bacterium ST9]